MLITPSLARSLSLSVYFFPFSLSVRERSPNPPVASVACALLTLIRPDAQLPKKAAVQKQLISRDIKHQIHAD